METLKETFKKSGILNSINSNLEKSFKEALEDEKFSSFIKKLKVDKNILMKYTSLLEESACEYDNCKNCKNILECKNKVKGHAYLPEIKKENINFNYKACKFQEKILKETKHLKNITLYQTPKKFLECEMSSVHTKDTTRHTAIKWALDFINNYPNIDKGLYLHGSFGCGKSYLISAILVELSKKDIKSTIVFWPEFLRDLKTYFGNNFEFDNIIKQIKNTPILFIDDIGAENSTAWARDEILATILDYRMNNKLTTFFTSNLTLSELETHFSQTKDGTEIVKARRIMERIKQLTEEVQLISKNLRN